MLAALYWNKSITREVIIAPGATDNYSRTRLQIEPNGTLSNLTRYFLYNRQGTHATIEGAMVVKRVDDLVLYRKTSAAPRVVDVIRGQLSNGFLSPLYRVRRLGIRPNEAHHVHAFASREVVQGANLPRTASVRHQPGHQRSLCVHIDTQPLRDAGPLAQQDPGRVLSSCHRQDDWT